MNNEGKLERRLERRRPDGSIERAHAVMPGSFYSALRATKNVGRRSMHNLERRRPDGSIARAHAVMPARGRRSMHNLERRRPDGSIERAHAVMPARGRRSMPPEGKSCPGRDLNSHTLASTRS